MPERYDVYGVGNAIVDTEVQIEETMLTTHSLERGVMTLVAIEDQVALIEGLIGHELTYAAGGSAANTMVGVARFGGRAFYAGKVGDDMPGALYRASMAEAGVDFAVEAAQGPTGSCLVLVTPDGERTMQTHLGASSTLGAADIHGELIAQSRMLYVEGYLWASDSTREAAEQAIVRAVAARVPVALSLSDPAMVLHFGDAFREIVRSSVDVLFCNEHEAAIYAGAAHGGSAPQTQRDSSLQALGADCDTVFMTCGADGSAVYNHGLVRHVEGHVVRVVDTTGAGDVYAAGALYGLTQGLSPVDTAKLGSYAAALVVTRLGPRLARTLADDVDAIVAGARPTTE